MSRIREYVRSQPRPSQEDALNFARSVLREKGAFEEYGPYCHDDGVTIENARKALEKHAFDVSEWMAFEMIEFALEEAA
jgi:hypothetical protein